MSNEKKKDIAILRSMGATQQSIRKIFLEGLHYRRGRHDSGVLLFRVCSLIAQYKFELPKDVFLISTVPVRIYWSNFQSRWRSRFVVCQHLSPAPGGEARSRAIRVTSCWARGRHKTLAKVAVRFTCCVSISICRRRALGDRRQSGVGKSTCCAFWGPLITRPWKTFSGKNFSMTKPLLISQPTNWLCHPITFAGLFGP
jgi:hypothetical protein